MEDAEDSKPIVKAPREADASTPEACAAVSEARAPLKSVDVQRGSNQPRTAWMVNSAILALNEPRGSSIQAIKKYMAKNYNIDTKKKALFIKKYLISAVDAGVLHRTRGFGAAGSFQVRKFNPPKQKPKAATKKAVTEKTAIAAKTPIAANKNLAKAFKKQTAADKRLAEVVKKQIAADRKLAEAVKKQIAADKKLAGAMKKLAAATKRAAAQKAAASVVSGKNVNKQSAADPPNAKTATSQ